jgi:hypothetical protein
MSVTLALRGKSPGTIVLEAVWVPVSDWTIWIRVGKEKVMI